MKRIINIHQTTFYIGLAIMLFISTSCLTDVDDVPQIEPKLVVHSFISPNDTIEVLVSKSIPLNYNQREREWNNFHPTIDNAVVTIQNTRLNNETTIPFDEGLGKYILTPDLFSIEAGEQYRLNVSAPNFKPVTAKTSIPSMAPNLLWLKVDTISLNDGFRYDVSGLIQDLGGYGNRYVVNVFTWREYYDFYYETDTTVIVTHTYQEFITNTGREGQQLGFRIEFYSLDWKMIKIHILHVDENYYKYHKHLYEIDYQNPFSEPTPLHTNIDGGLGVFASFVANIVQLVPSD